MITVYIDIENHFSEVTEVINDIKDANFDITAPIDKKFVILHTDRSIVALF